MFEYSNRNIVHHADHCVSLMIKRIKNLVLIRFCLFAVRLKLCMTRNFAYSHSSVASTSSISYNHIAGSSPSVLSLDGELPLGLAVEDLVYFRLMVFAILFSKQFDFKLDEWN